MSAVPHLGFIVAAYAATAVTLGATVLALIFDRRTQARLLARFERRADGAGPDRP